MDSLIFLIQQMMLFLTPLMIVALAGMFSERSGIINIALEGIMIIGALTGTVFINLMQKGHIMSGLPLLLTALLFAGLSGVLYSLFHAFASINMSANQTISGTALNIFAPAFAIYLARSVFGYQQVNFMNEFRIEKVPILGDIPLVGPMFFQNTYLTTFLGLAILIISHILIFKTRFGLRLRSAGEHPQTTDAAGLNVAKIRYSGVLISGLLGGLGGLIYILPISTNFNATVAGYGFLAMAVLIFGQWKPKTIFLVSAFFGLLKTISAAYSGIPFFQNLGLPSLVYKILPYVITIVVLFMTSKESAAPAALGEPFDKGKR